MKTMAITLSVPKRARTPIQFGISTGRGGTPVSSEAISSPASIGPRWQLFANDHFLHGVSALGLDPDHFCFMEFEDEEEWSEEEFEEEDFEEGEYEQEENNEAGT